VGGLDGDFVLGTSSASSGSGAAGGSSASGGAGGGGQAGDGGQDGNDCPRECDDESCLPWACAYSADGQQMVTDLAATSDGGVVIVGVFSGSIQLGRFTLEGGDGKPGACPRRAGEIPCPDGFVAKLGADGVVEWADVMVSDDGAVGEGSVYASMPDPSVAVGGSNADIVVAFQCEETYVGEQRLFIRGNGKSDLCVARWTEGGELDKVNSIGSDEDDDVGPIMVLGNNFFVGVVFGGSFEGAEPGSCWVVKLSSELGWGGGDLMEGTSVSAMTSGADDTLYVTGSTPGDADGAGGDGASTEAYVVRLGAAGGTQPRVSTSIAGTIVKPTAIAFDPGAPNDADDDRVIVGGVFTGQTDLGGTALLPSMPCAKQNGSYVCQDSFVASYEAGLLAFEDAAHCQAEEKVDACWISGIAVKDGDVRVAAWVTGNLKFGGVAHSFADDVVVATLYSNSLGFFGEPTVFSSSSSDYVTAAAYSGENLFVGGMFYTEAELTLDPTSLSLSVSDDAPDAFVLNLGSLGRTPE